jgi:hypothetical protein
MTFCKTSRSSRKVIFQVKTQQTSRGNREVMFILSDDMLKHTRQAKPHKMEYSK